MGGRTGVWPGPEIRWADPAAQNLTKIVRDAAAAGPTIWSKSRHHTQEKLALKKESACMRVALQIRKERPVSCPVEILFESYTGTRQ